MVRTRVALAIFVLVFILLFGLAASSRAEVVLTNIAPSAVFGSGIGLLSPPATTNTMRGQDFLTGSLASGYRLNSATLHMGGAAGNPGDFVLELYKGPLAGIADGPIGQFVVASNPTIAGEHTFDIANDIILAPGTRYMIVASAPDAAGPSVSQYGWRPGNFQPIPPSDAWRVGGQYVSTNSGANWTSVRSSPLQFAIDAMAIPEPVSVALAAIGLALLTIVSRQSFRS